ncbi:MAG: TspO/MBR family protein [Novosphingobium sp.]
MTELASAGQLRASLLRWALVLVPGVILLGFLSSQFGSPQSAWFENLAKPPINPPGWVFAPVWTVLYAMMGFAAAIVVSARGAWWRGRAAIAFLVQLVLNLAWSPAFFGMHAIPAALAVIVALDIAVVVTVWLFWKVRRLAALLLLPYLAWILFATVLNWQFLVYNPTTSAPATQRIQL